MSKKDLSETDIRTKFITPAVVSAGWDLLTQIREEVALTAGKVLVKGSKHKRGPAKYADYLLYYRPNLPIAVIEAKDNNHAVGDGMQQALGYADMHGGLPFVFSSNGDGFLFHDRTVTAGDVESELALDGFPSPETLWQRYCAWKGLDESAQQVIAQDYYVDAGGKAPRYYQLNAINRDRGGHRQGPETASCWSWPPAPARPTPPFRSSGGCGRPAPRSASCSWPTATSWSTRPRPTTSSPSAPRMTKIQNRQVDKSYEIYLALYQAVTGTEEEQEHLQAVLAGLLRPDRHRRVPPRQRRRRTPPGARSSTTSPRPPRSA